MTTPTEKIAAICKLLSDETRLNILTLLLRKKEDMCVMEIAENIHMSHSATSHQLARLEREGILSSFREGQTVCYHITDTPIAKTITTIVNTI